MNVVVVGAWNRKEQEDHKLVNALLDDLKRRYPKLRIISTGCDRGVGKIVKNRCMPQQQDEPGEIDFIEIITRIYVADINKADLAEIFHARNRVAEVLGEEFHIFVDHECKGVMYDLYHEVAESGRPVAVYYVGEATGPKVATVDSLAFKK